MDLTGERLFKGETGAGQQALASSVHHQAVVTDNVRDGRAGEVHEAFPIVARVRT